MTNITELPIEHISYSAMRKYVNNKAQFKKNYILGIWDYKTSPSMLAGSAFHKFAESYFSGADQTKSIQKGIDYIDSVPDNQIDYGKTGSREKVVDRFNKSVQFFLDELPNIGEVMGTEVTVITNKAPFENLALKTIIDCATIRNDELELIDWKTVSKYSTMIEIEHDGTVWEVDPPQYIMQAGANYFAAWHKYGQKPKRMHFVEIKVSRNKDGSPQIQIYTIDFDKNPKYIDYFLAVYTGIIRELAGQPTQFLPNFADIMDGPESVVDFLAETMNFEPVQNVTHKKLTTEIVDKPSYTESYTDSVDADNLSVSEQIAIKFSEFGAFCRPDSKYVGPNVTLYTFKPSRGIKMSKFNELGDDIAVALGAESVRVEAPLRGTKFIGVELANETKTTVNWTQDLVAGSDMNLPIPIGRDVYGTDQVIDLSKAPHLLVAGATGAGKSVFLNSVIKSLETKNAQLVLIDPKRTEFSKYKGKHQVYNEDEKIGEIFTGLAAEMEERYQKLEAMQVPSIIEYKKRATMNEKIVIVDELGDLIMGENGKKIQRLLVRLAQKARAAGIHLVLATQRPSVDVITGILKANLPTRVAFMTSSRVDSQVILDQTGAEQLTGDGDLLLMNPRQKGLLRLQGYFI